MLTKRLNERAYQVSNQASHQVEIVAVDIQTMAPIDGVTLIQGDITSSDTADKVIQHFKGLKAHLVVCDGAPDVTGQHDLDEFIQSQLLLAALNITTFILEESGTFLAKIFRGKDISLMISQFRLFFEQVQVVKPKSSRASSIEAFVVCQKFKLPNGYEPRMFDLLTRVEDDPRFGDILSKGSEAASIIPFLMCGDLNELKVESSKADNDE